jgi:hypothetical protein
VGITSDSIAMECALRKTTLAEVEIAFAGEETLAQHLLGSDQCAALGEILLIGYEDIANEIRMIEQIDALVADLEEHDVAVFPRGLHKKGQAAARELDEGVAWIAGAWTGRDEPGFHQLWQPPRRRCDERHAHDSE